MQQCFAQLSDPHLSSLEGVQRADLFSKRALGYLSWRRKRRFEHRMEVLDALVQDLSLDELDQLLITGDLTHIGLPSEFQQARDWLVQLGNAEKIAVIPGNHDACVAAPWEDTFALWKDYTRPDRNAASASEQTQYPTLRVRGEIAFIGLSTACPTPPFMATGTLGKAQLERLSPMLQDAKNRDFFRVVYLHHSPIKGQEKWRKRLTDAAQLQAVLTEQGVELVLHGHGHRAHYDEMGTRHGMAPVIAAPSASAMGLHGADVARYNRYQVKRIDTGWHLSIEPRCYQVEKGMFAEGNGTEVKLNRSVEA
jgi:3',5'-cyclic AMP phosphodiesterase CpdA